PSGSSHLTRAAHYLFFSLLLRPPSLSSLFPYTTLFRSSYIKTSLCPHSSHSPLTFNDSIIAFNSVSLKHSTQQIISHSHYLSVYSLIQDGALLLIFLLFQVLDMNLP